MSDQAQMLMPSDADELLLLEFAVEPPYINEPDWLTRRREIVYRLMQEVLRLRKAVAPIAEIRYTREQVADMPFQDLADLLNHLTAKVALPSVNAAQLNYDGIADEIWCSSRRPLPVEWTDRRANDWKGIRSALPGILESVLATSPEVL